MSDIHEKYIPEPNSGCWLWMGDIAGKGYGRWKGKAAHRVVYEDLKAPIPEGLVLDHLCRVTCCVNPDHLDPVTSRENTLRGIGPSAKHAVKTHCPKGHELSGSNLRLYRNKRYCKTCAKIHTANWWVKRGKAQRAALHQGGK